MTGDPETAPRRAFPPLYNSSGDLASDRLAFFHILERLKVCLVFLRPQRGSFKSVDPDAYRRHRSEQDGSITKS